jgi:hypothetical protein
MDDDKYIPTEEEKKRFGRVSNGYSADTSNKSNSKSKPKFDTRKVLNLLTHITPKLSSDQSRKKFQKFWFDCLQFSKDDVSGCIKFIRGNLNTYNRKDYETITSALDEIEERWKNAV